MPHKIKKVTPKTVDVAPPVMGRSSLLNEKFGITDAALALTVENEFEKGVASHEITGFAPELRADMGPNPNVDQNPYNFVAFAGDQPWMTAKEPAGHDVLTQFNGFLEFEAKALTPCFVPAGFPFAAGDPKPGGGEYEGDDLRTIPREFCTLVDAEGVTKYAIPGTSFKGALRSAVEAISNSRMGVADTTKLEPKHLYRRRVFTCGLLRSTPSGDWNVQEIHFPAGGFAPNPAENKAGLLAWYRRDKPPLRHYTVEPGTFRLSKELAESYKENIREHVHYKEHFRLHASNYAAPPPDWLDQLADLHDDDVIYCAVDASGKVQNFGKNVNYLWPASKSLAELVRAFLPREAPELDKSTDLAEHLFGFTPAREKGSAFRGLLQVQTLWGPEPSVQDTERLDLAPLTAPASQGKSRPLYLAPGPNGLAASFDDRNVQVRGRKFYWHQRAEDGEIWKKHTFAGTRIIDKELRKAVINQCPPPIEVLPKEVKFTGRIQFSNLGPHELGALLFALQGDGSYEHAFHLGKAKPRGLGSFQITVTKIEGWAPNERYKDLCAAKGNESWMGKCATFLEYFRAWSAACSRQRGNAPLLEHPHIKDFIKLHTWPASNSIRYYPINFSQYSWLPADKDARGEPKPPRTRPPAMRRARDINP